MSGWLARGSQRGEALMSRFRGASPLKDKEVDAGACFESFRIHWQQAWDMMQAHQGADSTTADDVNCVLNHVDQVCTLLLWDLKGAEEAAADGPADPSAPRRLRIFDLFLSERVLERLLDWSARCGMFEEQLRLEQLRIYEQLLRASAPALLVQRAVLRPLTSLLAGCRAAEQPVELHRRLVLVLAQLCAALHRHPPLLDLFLGGLDEDGQPTSFGVFAMLVDFVHRDGVIGHTDREALLLCMRLSRDNLALAQYIVQHSNFCPVLATGLSGLYSVLPRKLLLVTEDRYQLLCSDSKQVPELHSFVCSLDFCNSVLQVCHPLIADQLLDFVYHGFLVSVMGPALHQNSMEEIITATAYLDLFLRSIDQPGLVRTFLRLILAHKYEERRIIDTLVQRIAATSKLCVVTLSLLHTLLDLNCEDVMLELVFRHLLPCTHVMVSQRPRVREPDQHGGTARRLLELVPACCAPAVVPRHPAVMADSSGSGGGGGSGNGGRGSGGRQQLTQAASAPPAGGAAATSPAGANSGKQTPRQPQKQAPKKASKQSSSPAQCQTPNADGATDPTAAGSPPSVQFALQSHLSGFFEYAMDARVGVRACRRGCAGWTHAYDGVRPSPAEAFRMLRTGDSPPPPAGAAAGVERNGNGDLGTERTEDETGSIGESSGYQSFNPRLSPSPPPEAPEDALFWALVERAPTPERLPSLESSCKELDKALANLGVLASAADEELNGEGETPNGRRPPPPLLPLPLGGDDVGEVAREIPQSPTEMFGVTPSMGPFLDLLLTRLEEATTNGLQLNLQLMTVLTRLSLYPQPLLRSCLLDQAIVLQPSVRSLLQTLGKLKHRIDVATAALPQLSELVRSARARLAAREEHPITAASAPPAPAHSLKSEPRRLSLNSVASMLRRSLGGSNSGSGGTERPLEPTADGTGFRYTPPRPSSDRRMSAEDGAARRLVTAAVLLEQWLLELAAVSQEHAVACEYWEFTCF